MNRKNVEERSHSLICVTIFEELNITRQNDDKNGGCAGQDVNVGILVLQNSTEESGMAEEA
jgi:hypothetical protein